MSEAVERVEIIKHQSPIFSLRIVYVGERSESHDAPGRPPDEDTYSLGFSDGTLTLHTGALPDETFTTEEGIVATGNGEITGDHNGINVRICDRIIQLPWSGQEALRCTWTDGAQIRVHGGHEGG